LIAIRGTLESLTDCAASYAPVYLTSPFECFGDLESLNDFSSSSNGGVLSSSMDETLGRLKGLLLGVEQDGSSTCVSYTSLNTILEYTRQDTTFIPLREKGSLCKLQAC